jgi:hypothetical protein
MKVIEAVALTSLLSLGSNAFAECRGTVVEGETTVYPAPRYGNLECYPGAEVEDSRLASILALEFLLDKNPANLIVAKSTPSKLPKDEGGFYRTWEVTFQENGSKEFLVRVFIDADSREVVLFNDYR